MVKPICLEVKHQTRDLLEEVSECQTELDQVVKGFKTGDAMRGRVDGVLQAKLKVIEAQIAENNSGRQKIQSAIVSCQEIAKLSPGMMVSPVIRKEVEQLKKKIKEEVEKAKSFLDRVAPSEKNKVYNFLSRVLTMQALLLMFTSLLYFQTPTVEQPIAGQSVARKSVKRMAEAAAAVEEDGNESGQTRLGDSRWAFVAKCFSVHRIESDVISSFHCKDLLGHSGCVETVEFSDDGALVASAGHDSIVRLWPISNEVEVEIRGQNSSIAPIQMNARQASSVYTLAFAPDNHRLFSAGRDGKILVHDVQT